MSLLFFTLSCHFAICSAVSTFLHHLYRFFLPHLLCSLIFAFYRKDGLKEAILPVSPQILMVQCRDNSNSGCYYLTHIEDEQVKEYNRKILNNAVNFVIIENDQDEYF